MKTYDLEAVEYIAKLADGGLRDSLSLLDKCLSYSTELTVENVVKALGIASYDTMIRLTNSILKRDAKIMLEEIEKIHLDGKDLKQFVKDYMNFILDVNKYLITGNFNYTALPQIKEIELWLNNLHTNKLEDDLTDLLSTLINIKSSITYDSSPKSMIECMLLEVVK